ncbi:hypothetical protein N6H14_32810 [Paenibacillus sp. CC-CFT747]|nr:hypothetical protein N6H14_32810 [Paenibacillus sp. CC-CFT747]
MRRVHPEGIRERVSRAEHFAELLELRMELSGPSRLSLLLNRQLPGTAGSTIFTMR